MKTHADVHEAIEQLITGTRLTEFMVTTNSFRKEDGTTAVEWACCINSGRRDPEFYFRSRDPDNLIAEITKGVDARRGFFAINNRSLESLRGPAPRDTSMPTPRQRDRMTAPTEPTPETGHYHPTGEFPR